MYILSGRNWILYLINKITMYIKSGRNRIINYLEKFYKKKIMYSFSLSNFKYSIIYVYTDNIWNK
jgi:hypothetical protein